MTFEDALRGYYIGKPGNKNQWWQDVEIEVYFI